MWSTIAQGTTRPPSPARRWRGTVVPRRRYHAPTGWLQEMLSPLSDPLVAGGQRRLLHHPALACSSFLPARIRTEVRPLGPLAVRGFCRTFPARSSPTTTAAIVAAATHPIPRPRWTAACATPTISTTSPFSCRNGPTTGIAAPTSRSKLLTCKACMRFGAARAGRQNGRLWLLGRLARR